MSAVGQFNKKKLLRTDGIHQSTNFHD